MIVIDASALVAALLQTSAAEAVRRHLFAPNQSLHAPHLLDVEVTHVLRRYTVNRELDEERGRGALAAFPIRRYAHDLLSQGFGNYETTLARTTASMWRLLRRWALRYSPVIDVLPVWLASTCRSH